ncbi:Rieske (2Fe-2S) region [Streptomyces himastatinicus ATCC 53653]|uniref:Rieske (2Fe-2S) region n=1 Tax=Streptomyces himastatinicus ATCC 53653 TaxID=457427 RepID=D9W653_9ACTN|nr:Rieske (2Fe-2S) region [Streptomyces himastatinicus ATCC 53653]
MAACAGHSGESFTGDRCDFTPEAVAAPNLTSMPDVDRVEFGLVKVHVREWLGYVWVCLADDPPSFEEDVIGVVAERLGDAEAIANYGIDGLRPGRRITYDVQANWKLIVENCMECYHCATIHPELTEVLPEFADGFAAQYYVGHGAEFGEEARGYTSTARRGWTGSTGCIRWRPTARSWSATGSTSRMWSTAARMWSVRWNCSTR